MNQKIRLRLSAFEELFLRVDHINGPSNFFFKIELNCRLEQDRAQRALDRVCEIHPLASCRVVYDSKGRPHWQFHSDATTIEWSNQEFSEQGYPEPYFDPTQQRPLRVAYFPLGESESTLLFHAHHVAFDGLGFLKLLQDWILLYENENASLPKYEPRQLTRRCRPNVPFFKALRLLPGQWRSIGATFRTLGREVIPLLPQQNGPPATTPLNSQIISRTLDTSTTSSLRRFARQKNVSTNTALLENLFRAIPRWQQHNNLSVQGSHYRLFVPFDERIESHQGQSACNHCTVISLDRTPKELEDSNELLADIEWEVQLIKRWKLSLNAWRVLEVFRWLPGGLPKYVDTERALGTSLFSNLGKLDRRFEVFSTSRTGELRINNLEIVPPLQRGMMIAIVAYEHADQIRLTMQYNADELSEPQAKEFMDTLIDSNQWNDP